MIPTVYCTRFEGLCLTPGNKSAGFSMMVSTAALIELLGIKAREGEREQIMGKAKSRIANAELMGKRALESLSITYYEETLIPRVIASDPQLGGSIGADPETYGRLAREDALDYIGPDVEYTAHNLDSPKQALAAMLLAQTWSEAIHERLLMKRMEQLRAGRG